MSQRIDDQQKHAQEQKKRDDEKKIIDDFNEKKRQAEERMGIAPPLSGTWKLSSNPTKKFGDDPADNDRAAISIGDQPTSKKKEYETGYYNNGKATIHFNKDTGEVKTTDSSTITDAINFSLDAKSVKAEGVTYTAPASFTKILHGKTDFAEQKKQIQATKNEILAGLDYSLKTTKTPFNLDSDTKTCLVILNQEGQLSNNRLGEILAKERMTQIHGEMKKIDIVGNIILKQKEFTDITATSGSDKLNQADLDVALLEKLVKDVNETMAENGTLSDEDKKKIASQTDLSNDLKKLETEKTAKIASIAEPLNKVSEKIEAVKSKVTNSKTELTQKTVELERKITRVETASATEITAYKALLKEHEDATDPTEQKRLKKEINTKENTDPVKDYKKATEDLSDTQEKLKKVESTLTKLGEVKTANDALKEAAKTAKTGLEQTQTNRSQAALHGHGN